RLPHQIPIISITPTEHTLHLSLLKVMLVVWIRRSIQSLFTIYQWPISIILPPVQMIRSLLILQTPLPLDQELLIIGITILVAWVINLSKTLHSYLLAVETLP